MFSRWLRLGIRTQIMIIVMIGTVLTTAVTLLIADSSIQNYGSDQIKAQETNNLDVAFLVLKSQYGDSVSISANNQMVIDSPNISNQTYDANNLYGKLPLNVNTAYVDQVHALLKGNEVSVYQCANQNAQPSIVSGQLICPQISTTFLAHDAHGALTTVSVLDPTTNQQKTLDRDVNATGHLVNLPQDAIGNMKLTSASPQRFTGQEQIGGTAYIASYRPLFDPQNHLIGVLAVAEPLTSVTSLINNTTLELVISGVVIMIAGIIVAVLIASAISTTLQRAATQLSTASTQLSNISGQQAGGSRQQVWAINAINQALRNLQETSTDVSRRTDQLAQIGSQVAMRRAEISPAQFESVMGYMTRSVRDISVASHQQTTTIERMSGAMQAVVEIADQVAGTSQQTSESAKRLDNVVGDLKRLVAGRGQEKNEMPSGSRMSESERDMMAGATSGGLSSRGAPGNMPMSNAPSRPRNNDMAMPNPGRPMADAPRPGYGARPADGYPPANSRPMLPGPQRAQSRPPARDQGDWDRNRDDYSSSRNNQPGYGAQAPWSDYGRNHE